VKHFIKVAKYVCGISDNSETANSYTWNL